MKILLLGSTGQVGWELQRSLAPLGQVIAPVRKELDLLDLHAVRSAVRSLQPGIIVNAAAYTAVDQAEKEPSLAEAVNTRAPQTLAEEAAKSGALLVHYSTDYIFDGTKKQPYEEDDTPNPLNVYGQTKLQGENLIRETKANHLILRTSWVYSSRGSNFLLTILKMAREKDCLRVVNDQYGSPTWARIIAAATAQLLAKSKNNLKMKKLYHISSAGETTWHHFARTILKSDLFNENISCRVEPIKTEQFKTPARRPAYSILSSKLINREAGLMLPDWQYLFLLFVKDSCW